MVGGVGVVGEGEAWAAGTASTRAANGTSTDTVAATNREWTGVNSPNVGQMTGCHGDVRHQHVSSRVCSSNQKNEEKRGGSGSNNWGSVKDEVRLVYFYIFHIFLLCAKPAQLKERAYVFWC